MNEFFSVRNCVWIFLIALTYFVGGLIGHMLAVQPGFATPVWLPSGIALASVILFGNRILPAVFLGSFFYNSLLVPDSHNVLSMVKNILALTGVSMGASLQACVGGFLIHRYIGFRPFDTTANVFKFIIIAIISCLINSNIGLFSLSLVSHVDWFESWWTWWIGDINGILIFTPFILVFFQYTFPKITLRNLIEIVVLAILIYYGVNLMFSKTYHLTYTMIPLIVWAGFRYYQIGVSFTLVLIFIMTVWYATHDFGPFFVEGSQNTSLLLLDLFFSILTSMGFLLVAALTERRKALNQLKGYNIDLEKKVQERTLALQQMIDEIKQMQGYIITKEKLATLGTLTAGVAHEIKNPISFIVNFSEASIELLNQITTVLESQKSEWEVLFSTEVPENLKLVLLNNTKILEHAKRGSTIVQGMLLHARAMPGEFQATDLNELIQVYLKLSFHSKKQQYTDFNVQIKTELQTDLKPLFLNKQDISRVILNVLDNAFDALAEKCKLLGSTFQPQILVITRDLGNSVEINFRDNGVGIPTEFQDKIFIPFFTLKPAGMGTGLGLSISYDIIVKGHHGTIEIDSKAGEYALFKIILPKNSQSKAS